LAHLHGNLAALTIRFLDIFALPIPEPDQRDDNATMLAWLRTLAATLPAARGVAALHDAMLAVMAFPSISAEDYGVLREPWAAVCLPSEFGLATILGEDTPAAQAILAEIHELPGRRLRLMAATRGQVSDAVWAPAMERLGAAGIASGYPFRARVLYWGCVNEVEDVLGEVPTDRAIVEAAHGMAAARLLTSRLDDETAAVLEGPYWRALG